MSCGVFSSDIDKNIEVTATSSEFVGYTQGDSLDKVLSKIDSSIDKLNTRLEKIECSCAGDPCDSTTSTSNGSTGQATSSSAASTRSLNLSSPYTISTSENSNTITVDYNYYDAINNTGGVAASMITIKGNDGKVYTSTRKLIGSTSVPYTNFPISVKLGSDINLDGSTYSISSNDILSPSTTTITDYLLMVDATTESNKLNSLETQVNKLTSISIDGNSDIASILSQMSADIKTLQTTVTDNSAINTINERLDKIDVELTRLSGEVIRIDSKV